MITEVDSSFLRPNEERGAIFSDDRRCRFRLWDLWDMHLPKLVFIMLNPSKAGAYEGDPTARKCVGFARRWGFGRVTVVNVYPFIATDPKKLERGVGLIENVTHLRDACSIADRIVCAWGANVRPADASAVLRSIAGYRDVVALRRTKGGFPEHPLYVPYDVEPIRYP